METFCGILTQDMVVKGDKVTKELKKKRIKMKNSMLFLKQDANNFVAKENCWNFITITFRTNGCVLSLK